MIVYPKNWKKDYSKYANIEKIDININKIQNIILDNLKKVLKNLKINNLAYSGGIDSTIILTLMSRIFLKVNTFTISSRETHPDITYSRICAKKYKSNHTEFIVIPDTKETDLFEGDNAVRMLFERCGVKDVICCDGIDEFMCGYYLHQKDPEFYYKKFLSELLEFHLIPLDKNSKEIRIYLPYLNDELINFLAQIDVLQKVDNKDRKKIIIQIGRSLKIPASIIWRNKYGFIDAFKDFDK